MLNLYFSRLLGEKKVSLYITPCESKEEVVKDVRSAGSDEEIVAFLSLDCYIAGAISCLALGQDNIEDWESFLLKIAQFGSQLAGNAGVVVHESPAES